MTGGREGRWAGAALAAICLGAFAQRRLGLSSWSYWLDEAMQVANASGSLRETWRALVFDGVHPPLDGLLTWAALHLSRGSESATRLLPALFSSLACTAIFVAAGGTRRPARALGAALFLAATPLSCHLGQEVRPYALALLLLALAAALVERRASHAYIALASLAAALTLYLALFPLGLLWLVHAARTPRGERVRALLVPVPALLALGMWLWLVRGSLLHPGERIPPDLSLASLSSLAAGLLSWREASLAFLAGALVPALLVTAGLLRSAKRDALAPLLLLATAAGTALFLAATTHWLSLRYFSLALVPLALLSGSGLEAMAVRTRGAAAGAAALLVLFHLPAYREISASARPDWRRVAEYLAFRAPGEPVAAPDEWTWLSLRVQPAVAGRVHLVRGPHELAGVASGWFVTTPASVPAWGRDLLGETRPWGTFPDAEGARVFRVRHGAVVPP